MEKASESIHIKTMFIGFEKLGWMRVDQGSGFASSSLGLSLGNIRTSGEVIGRDCNCVFS